MDTFATYDNLEEKNMLPSGCDFSHWNTKEIFEKYCNKDFSILKVSEGTNYIDPTFNERIKILKENEKPVGLYHFLVPNKDLQFLHFYSEIRKQVFNNLKHVKSGFDCNIFAIVDFEGKANIEDLQTFVINWFKISNLPLVIYTSVSWYKNLKLNELFKDYNIKYWLAGWTNHNEIIKERMKDNNVILYQFTNKYDGNNLDCNYFKYDISYFGYHFKNSNWFFKFEV